ncbi:putative Ig domain-containing protein [Paenibacillus favisporus]|nr:LamG-like jellyroll fold domain-containing protein [Paenibacillus favisporus]MEC0176663.1 putative Ig domain-containing protein [Paenibacillus favisporus]
MKKWMCAVVSLSLWFSACAIPVGAEPNRTVQNGTEAFSRDAEIVDIFGRTLNDYGIELVDWQGYIANPYVKLNVVPPKDAAYPLTIGIKAKGTSRLMMDRPSTLSATGAEKTLTFQKAGESKPFLLEIHPDRGGGEIENYTLEMTVTDANGEAQMQSTPIRVWDQDDEKEEHTLPLKFDYRYDTIQPYFSDPAIRKASEQAIKDWFYFFDMEPFDTVPANAEVTRLPEDNFDGHTTVTNDEPYNGMWIYLRGINGPYSTGGASDNGTYHKRNGVTIPDKLHRSLVTILDFYDTAKPFTSLNDEEWYLTEMSDTSTDVYGLIMHEFGHALAFSSSWKGMAAYKRSGGTADNIVAYQGNPVPLDDTYHIPGEAPYWDRISGQNGGRTHLFHNKRWMLTKLTLLIAEKAGWKLNRELTPFLSPSIKDLPIPNAKPGQEYELQLQAEGGVPFYDWTIAEGSLPDGLILDRFTGKISGKVSGNAKGSYKFTVQLRDYDEMGTPVQKELTLNVGQGELAGSYLFEEGKEASEEKAIDYSGSGHDADLHDAVHTDGARGGGISLNGLTSYMALPDRILKGASELTFSAWVRMADNAKLSSSLTEDADSARGGRIFDFGAANSKSMSLSVDAKGNIGFTVSQPGKGESTFISGPGLTPGEWHHAALTLSGKTAVLYLDGAELARSTNVNPGTVKSVLNSGTSFYIGRSQGDDHYWAGTLDEIKLYQRALSGAEIAGLAEDKPVPPVVDPPVPVNPNAAVDASVTTSYVSPWESLVGLNDEFEPSSSADRGHPIYGNWDTHGTEQWVQYNFDQPVTLSSSEVYWFDDHDGIDLPASFYIQYWDGSAWVEVSNPSEYGVLPDQFNVTTFDPVTTTKIRLTMKAKETTSTGIQQWKVIRSSSDTPEFAPESQSKGGGMT